MLTVKPLSISSGFTGGVNALSFVVLNDAGTWYNPSGFRADLRGTARVATAVSLSAGAAPAAGQPATLTATVAVVAAPWATPTGTVSFSDNGTLLGAATVADGVATFTTPALAGGQHSFTASYLGQGDVAPSQSAAAAQSVAGTAPAAVPFAVYSTGVDDAGALIGAGAADPHYTQSGSAAAYATLDGYPFGPWVGNGTASRWVSPHANQNGRPGGGGVTEAAGTYTFRTTFDLTGYDAATARVGGLVTADNTLVQVLLNGQDVGYQASGTSDYGGLRPLDITGGFLPGLNTLTFVTENYDGSAGNAVGLRTELAGTALQSPGGMSIDLQADTNVDGHFDQQDDPLEDDSIGKLILENTDDDDADGLPDRDQSGSNPSENDLAAFKLSVPQADSGDYAGWLVRLTATDGTPIRAWDSPYKDTPIDLSKTYVLGTDAIPSVVYVEGVAQAVVLLTLLLQDPQGAVQQQDDVTVRVMGLELDVNANASTTDAVDGFHNYMPGYEGGVPKLSAGPFNATAFTPQQMRLVVGNAGSDSGVTTVDMTLVGATNRSGYTGNASDPSLAGGNSSRDFSFAKITNRYSATMSAGQVYADMGIATTYSWADFYCKDYAASGAIKLYVFGPGGRIRYRTPELQPRQVVRDGDGDGIQDGWESAAVTEYEAQYGLQFTVGRLGVFGAGESPTHEGHDVDSPPGSPGVDGDGGRNMVPHKTAGDSLTTLQEYRGFILDGGGFDGAGANGHSGGHKRLSPAFKELLIEVDAMTGFAAALTPLQLKAVLNGVAKGYSDTTSGAGIRVYWVVDESSLPNVVLRDSSAAKDWAYDHRNPLLDEFVHLMYANKLATDSPYGETYRNNLYTNSGGSFVFLGTIATDVTSLGLPAAIEPWLINTTAHEICHTIIDTISANGFDGAEHVKDPDGDGIEGGRGDIAYLMVRGSIRTHTAPILFDDMTRGQIDLTKKASVEW